MKSIILALLLSLAALPAWADDARIDCQGCHTKTVSAAAYGASAHRDLACTACHIRDLKQPVNLQAKDACVVRFAKTDCARCHARQTKEHEASVHNGKRLPIACAQCHNDIHALTPHKGDKLASAALCGGCHARQKPYFSSIHYQALQKGSKDAPSCTDCHGNHTVARVDNDAKGRDLHSKACLHCHDDRAMMTRNKVTTIAGATFFDSFHGKNVRLGYPEQVAGCADCHTAHAVHKADNPASTVHPSHLVATCQTCHKHANAAFAQYAPHAQDHDRSKFPVLYWTRTAMTGLLVGTFLFFWLHSLLWALRAFVDRQRKVGHVPASTPAAPAKVYRRFGTLHIAMHLVVIVSFLTLALTGLPLKFGAAPWGKALMDLIGGAARARLIHHSAAVVTFGYFAVALALSARFLLARSKGQSLGSRLFGPDSLMPNLRDWRDMKAMFRWFFFAGPKPSFERWTYWEKFDFMAVFWGMFAIGSSGLLLWFPEFFARFVPGWLFNVATIVHSDEALLATGFIFTVHFFNTHFRPEKFPMDVVIFNGRISEEELREERGDQLARLQAEQGIAALLETRPSPMWWEFTFRIIGLTAVLIGLSLAVGMVWALVTNGL